MTVTEPLTLDVAVQLLRRFTCLDRLTPEDIPAPEVTRQALHIVADRSDYQIFGICADTVAEANQALQDYLAVLQYDDRPTLTPLEGPVYVKYNPHTGLCHAAPYGGEYRGVLVSCQSAYDQDINETFGHLPLDLFAG